MSGQRRRGSTPRAARDDAFFPEDIIDITQTPDQISDEFLRSVAKHIDPNPIGLIDVLIRLPTEPSATSMAAVARVGLDYAVAKRAQRVILYLALQLQLFPDKRDGLLGRLEKAAQTPTRDLRALVLDYATSMIHPGTEDEEEVPIGLESAADLIWDQILQAQDPAFASLAGPRRRAIVQELMVSGAEGPLVAAALSLEAGAFGDCAKPGETMVQARKRVAASYRDAAKRTTRSAKTRSSR